MPDTARVARLLRGAIERLELDLGGAVVLTEAATNAFASAAVAAAAAGARRVHAVAAGDAGEALAHVEGLAEAAVVDLTCLEVHEHVGEVPAGIDVITSLAPLRPVGRRELELLTPAGAVSLMYEAWELRPDDVDLDACRELGVPVAGVAEDFDGLAVFRSCGPLALKLLFEAGLEVAGNRIVVLSGDRFGEVIAPCLEAAGAEVVRAETPQQLDDAAVEGADALLAADWGAEADLLGGDRGPDARRLAELSPDLRIVQLAGPTAVEALREAGLGVHPDRRLRPREMGASLAHLGPRPVVNLRVAGLKVGELLWRRRRDGGDFGRYQALVQQVA